MNKSINKCPLPFSFCQNLFDCHNWLFWIYWRHEIGETTDELCYSLVDLLIMLVIWKDLSSNGEFHLAHRAVWKFHGEIAFKGGTGRALIPVYFYTHPQFSIGSTTENSINNILMKWVLLHNDWSAECCFFMWNGVFPWMESKYFLTFNLQFPIFCIFKRNSSIYCDWLRFCWRSNSQLISIENLYNLQWTSIFGNVNEFLALLDLR